MLQRHLDLVEEVRKCSKKNLDVLQRHFELTRNVNDDIFIFLKHQQTEAETSGLCCETESIV